MVLKELYDIIQNFICEGKTAKIAQNTLIKNFNESGLKLSHYPTKIDALKLSWMKRVFSDTEANSKNITKTVFFQS